MKTIYAFAVVVTIAGLSLSLASQNQPPAQQGGVLASSGVPGSAHVGNCKGPNCVDPDHTIRLYALTNDQKDQTNKMLRLQSQYTQVLQPIQESLVMDQKEIDEIKAEACKEAKRGDDCDVDLNEMTYITKPKPPTPKPQTPAPPATPPSK